MRYKHRAVLRVGRVRRHTLRAMCKTNLWFGGQLLDNGPKHCLLRKIAHATCEAPDRGEGYVGGFVLCLGTGELTSKPLEKGWWVDAQAHLPTTTENSAVYWPPLGTSTTRPPQEVQVTAAQ